MKRNRNIRNCVVCCNSPRRENARAATHLAIDGCVLPASFRSHWLRVPRCQCCNQAICEDNSAAKQRWVRRSAALEAGRSFLYRPPLWQKFAEPRNDKWTSAARACDLAKQLAIGDVRVGLKAYQPAQAQFLLQLQSANTLGRPLPRTKHSSWLTHERATADPDRRDHPS